VATKRIIFTKARNREDIGDTYRLIFTRVCNIGISPASNIATDIYRYIPPRRMAC